MKTLIAVTALTAFIWFNWDKVPQPIKKVLGGIKTVSGEVIEKGQDMPDPVKQYVDSVFAPKVDKLKEKLRR